MKQIAVFFCAALFVAAAAHANPALIGTWKAEVEGNRAFDIQLTISENGRCTVRVTDENTMQESPGNWSFDGSVLVLNATFRNAAISYVPNIRWTSALNLNADGNSFSILGVTSTGGRQSRIVFWRQNGEGNPLPEIFNPRAIAQIFVAFSRLIPAGSSVAIIGIDSGSPNEAVYYANDLAEHFVNAGNYTILNRRNIDSVIRENDFQLSGMVDDNEIVSIGKFLSASIVISGSVDVAGAQKILTLRAIEVLTSKELSTQRVTL